MYYKLISLCNPIDRYKAAIMLGITGEVLAEKENSYYSWKKKCSIQLSTLSMCKSHRVFDIIPPEVS
jgi:hypothetical protein